MQVVSEDVGHRVVYLFIQLTVQVISEGVSHVLFTYLSSLRCKWSVKMYVTWCLLVIGSRAVQGLGPVHSSGIREDIPGAFAVRQLSVRGRKPAGH